MKKNKSINFKKFAIIFYSFGIFFIIIPLILNQCLQLNITFLNNLYKIIHFQLNIYVLLILILLCSFIFIYELLIYNNKKEFLKNYKLIKIIFEEKNIFLLIFICFLAGLFEELFFRGTLYCLMIDLLNKIMKICLLLDILTILIISVIFGLLHLNQGLTGFIISLYFSLLFFLSIKLSNTIWYAVLLHTIINLIEIIIVIPIQIKKFNKINKS